MANTVPAVVKHHIDTAANLASLSVAPLSGELVVESDTKKFKFGDGSTLYSALSYGSTATTGTASGLTSSNPTLSAGEWGLETDTLKAKLGDGSTAWTSLKYSAISDIDAVLDTKITGSTEQLLKAKVSFNGTLTGTISPISGYNVTNITKNGTGDYTINFTDPLPNANYLVFPSTNGNTPGSDASTSGSTTTAYATTSVRIGCTNAANTSADYSIINVLVC